MNWKKVHRINPGNEEGVHLAPLAATPSFITDQPGKFAFFARFGAKKYISFVGGKAKPDLLFPQLHADR